VRATGFNGKTAGPGVIRDGFGVGGLQTAAAQTSPSIPQRTSASSSPEP
jgi:hypothetical protein